MLRKLKMRHLYSALDDLDLVFHAVVLDDFFGFERHVAGLHCIDCKNMNN